MSLDESKYENPCRVVLSLCDYSGAWSRPFIADDCIVVRVDPKHGAVDQGGTGYTTGSAGSGDLYVMPDGGYGLALTAGALADRIEEEGGYFLDNLLWRIYSQRGFDCCEVDGVLIAAPCTDFASSGARWFAQKDADGRTEASISIVRDCLRVVDEEHGAAPNWWVLENPIGRIQRCVPELGDPLLRFDPCEYAGFADEPEMEAYTKRTALYGKFDPVLPRAEVEPQMITLTRKDGRKTSGSWMWAYLGGKSERTKELRSMTPTGFARAFAYAQDRVGRLYPEHKVLPPAAEREPITSARVREWERNYNFTMGEYIVKS